MAVIVVTRLRLADHAVLDDFFEAKVALLEQADASPGVVYTAVLPDWDVAPRHLVADGRSSQLVHASGANATRSFPAPVVAP